jgi:hypothetical protein
VKTLHGLSGIYNARFAFEVTLFANTISGFNRQLSRIDYIARRWVPNMVFTAPVTPIAGDGSHTSRRNSPLVRVCELRVPRMAEQTGLRDRPVKIDQLHTFVTGRNIPAVIAIPGDGRLQQVIPNINGIRPPTDTATDLIRYRVFGGQAALRQAMDHASIMDFD